MAERRERWKSGGLHEGHGESNRNGHEGEQLAKSWETQEQQEGQAAVEHSSSKPAMAMPGKPAASLADDNNGSASECDTSGSGVSRRSAVRRSLPVLMDPVAEYPFSERTKTFVDQECYSEGNSPALSPTGKNPPPESDDGRPASLHKTLPSLHLNARCLKCDRVGVVYCKGCEAHFCAKHDQRRHRFMLRKDGHHHEELPGISYFRIPMPNASDSGCCGSEIGSEDSVTPTGSLHSMPDDVPVEAYRDGQARRPGLRIQGDGGSEDRDGSAKGRGSRAGEGGEAAGGRHQGSPATTFAATPASASTAAVSPATRGGGSGSAQGGDVSDRNTVADIIADSGNSGRDRRGAAVAGASNGAGGRGGVAMGTAVGRGGQGAGAGAGNSRRAARRGPSAIDLARNGWYNQIVMAIVRPPRCKYSEQDLGPVWTPLGSGITLKRTDFVVRNRRGLNLMCSQWRPSLTEDTSQLPCVVYLHGNSSARVDVVKTRSLAVLGAAPCTVVSFDFSGSGMSEGDWVTLGYFEQHDVADVLAYLRSNGMANRYLLWGRSMGAASALMYAERYPNSDLCGLILDSPFCSFRQLAKDLVTQGQVHVPGFLVNGALGMLRRSVRKRTRCDLKTLAPIDRAKDIQCPCLFIAARKDVMVRPTHGAALSDAVAGASMFITCRGTHNTSRPGVVLAAIGTFVKGCFRGRDVPISTAFDAIQAKLEEAQATSAALRQGRTSASSSTAANSSSISQTGHSRAGTRGAASAPAEGATTASAVGADAAAGGGARPPTRVDYTTKIKERRGGQGLKPPFAPGALASRSVWKNPAEQRQHDGTAYRLSSGADGTQARPPSLASSLHSNSSGDSGSVERGRLKRELPLSKRKPAAVDIHGIKEDSGDDTDDRAQRDPRRAVGMGVGAEPAVIDEVPSSSHHRRLPSWRDTIFNERPHRGMSFEHPPPRDSPAGKATPVPTSTDGTTNDDARMTAIPHMEPAYFEATKQQAAALRAPQVPPTARTPPTASASSASTEFPTVIGAEEEGGRRASSSRRGSVNRRNSGTSSGSGGGGGSVVTAADVSARSRATRKAFQMASNGNATAGGRGTRQPYGLPQPIVPSPTQHPAATVAAAGGSGSGGAGAGDAGASASSSNEGHAPGRPWPPPPPADAVHQVLAGVRLRPADSSSRPGPKGSVDSTADFLEEEDDRRNRGDSGTEGAPQQQQGKARDGRRHHKGRWTASGPLLGRSDYDGGTPSNGDVPRDLSGGWRTSGPLTGGVAAERRRGTPRNGWWGRVRVKTPMLTVFRSGHSSNNTGSGRASAGNSRNSGGLSALPSGLGGVGLGSARLSSSRRRCSDCGKPSVQCMCSVEEPVGRDGALQRRPSPLRTKSGRLKM